MQNGVPCQLALSAVKLTEIPVFDNVCYKFGMTNLPFG